eukprot:TRINITY_DN14964_c0_g1_i1.p1 TRINITY_DN14964_c0_g1~~TRINITY_DN14964_c0_g1_i1.p1  ORF type:complete len:911 (+),score=207.16 TRINITY_DN14964_c0_g1_i1:183-2915(+)
MTARSLLSSIMVSLTSQPARMNCEPYDPTKVTKPLKNQLSSGWYHISYPKDPCDEQLHSDWTEDQHPCEEYERDIDEEWFQDEWKDGVDKEDLYREQHAEQNIELNDRYPIQDREGVSTNKNQDHFQGPRHVFHSKSRFDREAEFSGIFFYPVENPFGDSVEQETNINLPSPAESFGLELHESSHPKDKSKIQSESKSLISEVQQKLQKLQTITVPHQIPDNSAHDPRRYKPNLSHTKPINTTNISSGPTTNPSSISSLATNLLSTLASNLPPNATSQLTNLFSAAQNNLIKSNGPTTSITTPTTALTTVPMTTASITTPTTALTIAPTLAAASIPTTLINLNDQPLKSILRKHVPVLQDQEMEQKSQQKYLSSSNTPSQSQGCVDQTQLCTQVEPKLQSKVQELEAKIQAKVQERARIASQVKAELEAKTKENIKVRIESTNNDRDIHNGQDLSNYGDCDELFGNFQNFEGINPRLRDGGTSSEVVSSCTVDGGVPVKTGSTYSGVEKKQDKNSGDFILTGTKRKASDSSCGLNKKARVVNWLELLPPPDVKATSSPVSPSIPIPQDLPKDRDDPSVLEPSLPIPEDDLEFDLRGQLEGICSSEKIETVLEGAEQESQKATKGEEVSNQQMSCVPQEITMKQSSEVLEPARQTGQEKKPQPPQSSRLQFSQSEQQEQIPRPSKNQPQLRQQPQKSQSKQIQNQESQPKKPSVSPAAQEKLQRDQKQKELIQKLKQKEVLQNLSNATGSKAQSSKTSTQAFHTTKKLSTLTNQSKSTSSKTTGTITKATKMIGDPTSTPLKKDSRFDLTCPTINEYRDKLRSVSVSDILNPVVEFISRPKIDRATRQKWANLFFQKYQQLFPDRRKLAVMASLMVEGEIYRLTNNNAEYRGLGMQKLKLLRSRVEGESDK